MDITIKDPKSDAQFTLESIKTAEVTDDNIVTVTPDSDRQERDYVGEIILATE